MKQVSPISAMNGSDELFGNDFWEDLFYYCIVSILFSFACVGLHFDMPIIKRKLID